MFKKTTDSNNTTNTTNVPQQQQQQQEPLYPLITTNAAQTVVTNLTTLLPAQCNALLTFEGRVKNKILLTAKNQSNDDLDDNNNDNDDEEREDFESIFGNNNKKTPSSNQSNTNNNTNDKPTTLSGKSSLVSMFGDENRNNLADVVVGVNPFCKKNNVKKQQQKKHEKKHEKISTTVVHRLSSKQRKTKQLQQFPRYGLNYTLLLPTYHLFQSYLYELIGVHNTNLPLIEQQLLRIDFHGAILNVIKSKNPQYIGKCGIVIKETQYSFLLLNSQNNIVTIPKSGVVFQLDISFLYPSRSTAGGSGNNIAGSGSIVKNNNNNNNNNNTTTTTNATTTTTTNAIIDTNKFDPITNTPIEQSQQPVMHSYAIIYGDQIMFRPHDRLTRKFKVNNTIELK